MVVRWSDTLHITRPHNASASRVNLLQKSPSNDGDKCVQFNQTARKKKAWLCRDPVTNKKTLQLRGVIYSRKRAKCPSRDHTTQRKHWWSLALFFAEKETVELPLCDSKLLGEGDSIMVVCSPKDRTMRTQDERLLSYTIKTDETKHSKPRFRNKRPARVMVMGEYHKTTLCKYPNDRRWDLCANKKTSCQPNSCANVLQKSCWYGVFITEPHRATCSCFQHKDDDKLRPRITRGWLPPCQSSFVNESLSDLGGMEFITKTHNTNVARIITGTFSQTRTLNKFHMRTNTSGQDTLKCDSARCVPETTQCNKRWSLRRLQKTSAPKTVRMSTKTLWRVRSSKIIQIGCSSQDHGEPTLQGSSPGPAHNVSLQV